MTRLVAVHFCPVEKKAALTVFSTAELKSASASTMVGFLPPISSWMRIRRLEASVWIQWPTSLEPVKEMALTGRGIDERAAEFPARSGDEVDHAFRHAGLVKRFDDAPGAERRDGSGLDDDGVAADQRGRHLPGGNGDGEVPGRDEADHADGLRMAKVWTRSRSEGVRMPPAREPSPGVVAEDVDGAAHFALGFGKRLAFFAGHLSAELIELVFQNVGGFEEDGAARRAGHDGPGGQSFGGGGGGVLDIGGAAFGVQADDLIGVGGVAVFDVVAAIHPLAGNVVCENRCAHEGVRISDRLKLWERRARRRRS